MKRVITLITAVVMIFTLAACSAKPNLTASEQGSSESVTKAPEAVAKLPAAKPDSENQFGVDKNINISTIDDYLGRDDTVYRDMRMLFDPAEYADIGGEADLTSSIKGFRITPFPYIATLQQLPVDGAYDGDHLFDVEWNKDGTVKSATPVYEESMLILEELFPKDKNIFLICGGAGYAGMTRTLLVYLGWDEAKVYNVGAAWSYKGENEVELAIYPEDADEDTILATWRADYAYIEFSKLHKVEAD